MRTLFWLTSITLVAAAVATVSVADYINSHPSSVLGRQASQVVAWWTRANTTSPGQVAAEWQERLEEMPAEFVDYEIRPPVAGFDPTFDQTVAATSFAPPFVPEQPPELFEQLPEPVQQVSYENSSLPDPVVLPANVPPGENVTLGVGIEPPTFQAASPTAQLPAPQEEEEDADDYDISKLTPSGEEDGDDYDISKLTPSGEEAADDCDCECCEAFREFFAGMFDSPWFKLFSSETADDEVEVAEQGAIDYDAEFECECECADLCPARPEKCCTGKSCCEKCNAKSQCKAEADVQCGHKRCKGEDACCSAAVNAKLEETVWIDFNQRPLCQVIDELRCLTGFNVYVDKPWLDCENVCMDTPITVHLQNVPMKTALKYVLGYVALDYKIQDGIIVVTTPSGAKSASTSVGAGRLPTTTHYVGDLVIDPTKPGQTCEDSLIQLVRETIEPATWAPEKGHISYYPIGMGLVVMNSNDVQEQVAALLDQLRELQNVEDHKVSWPRAFQTSICPECGVSQCAHSECTADKTKCPAKCCEMVKRTYTVADWTAGFQPEDANKLSEGMIKLVTDAIEPASWDCSGGKGHIEYSADQKCLVVQQTPDTHELVRKFFDNMRQIESLLEEGSEEDGSIAGMSPGEGLEGVQLLWVELENENADIQIKKDEHGAPCIHFSGGCIHCMNRTVGIMVQQSSEKAPMPQKIEDDLPKDVDAAYDDLPGDIDASAELERVTEILQAIFNEAETPERCPECDESPRCPRRDEPTASRPQAIPENERNFRRAYQIEDPSVIPAQYRLNPNHEPRTPEDLPICDQPVLEKLDPSEKPASPGKLELNAGNAERLNGCYFHGTLDEMLKRFADRRADDLPADTDYLPEIIPTDFHPEPSVPAREGKLEGEGFLYPSRHYPDVHTTEFRHSDVHGFNSSRAPF